MDLTTYRILDALSRNPGKRYSINGLVRRIRELEYSAYYKNIYERVQELRGDGLLDVRKTGNTLLVSLDFDNMQTIDELAIMELEKKKKLLKKHSLEEEFIKSIGSTNATSIILVQPERNLKLNALELLYLADEKDAEAILKNCRKIGGKHNMAVYPLALTADEIREMLESKEHNQVKEVLKDKVVLTNPEEFWKTVCKAAIGEIEESELRIGKMSTAELYYNLDRFGYTGFTKESVSKTVKVNVETTMTACLLREDARLMEAIPLLLAKNKVNYRLLLYLAVKHRKVNTMGYLIEVIKTFTENEGKRKILSEALKLFELVREPARKVKSANPLAKRWGIETRTTIRDLEEKMRLYNAV